MSVVSTVLPLKEAAQAHELTGCRLAAASPNAAKKAEEEPGSDQAYHREE
jgi:hypothetical protein